MSNKFKFEFTNCDGVTNASEFMVDTWPEAVENFTMFLRGAGFIMNGELELVNDEDGVTYSINPNFKDSYADTMSNC